jgi:hypothetical protein
LDLQLPIQSVSFTTNVVISKPVHCELDTTLCDKVRQLLVPGWWFSPVSSTNKGYSYEITDILLKVALNTITLSLHMKKAVG